MSTVTAPRRDEPLRPVPTPPRPASEPPRLSRSEIPAARASRGPRFALYPEDGIVTVLLVAAVVYITTASIQAVTPPWAPGLSILTPLTLLGLFVGYLAVQQRVIPAGVVHVIAVLLGCALAFWQTAQAEVGGDYRLLATHVRLWIHQALHNQASSDNTVFVLFLAALTFMLAYLSMWLVLRSRQPWLAALANGVVLLINLNFASPDILPFLVVYLLAALLLLVRFTLADNVRVWRARRLRYSPDLNWDFLQAGAFFAVVVLLLAYLLPAAPANATINRALNDPNGVLKAFQHRWEGLFGSLNGPGTTGVGFFSSTLQLKGDVDLSPAEIFRYTSTDPSEYLISQTFDTYDGHASWSQSLTISRAFAAAAVYPTPSSDERLASQTVELTDYGNGQRTLFAAGEPATFSLATDVAVTVNGNIATSWSTQRDLVTGQSYSAQSYLSTATEDQLRAVPYPFQATNKGTYPPDILNLDLNSTATTISPEVVSTAASWAASAAANNPYDVAVALENHLRTFHYSTHNGTVPSNEDAVVWFLHNQKGFCTFFAATMALMARSLGMPARIATAVINGEYDPEHHNYVVKGTSLHVWTQIYFAGYGWINFEPTSSFPAFERAPSATTATGATPNSNAGPGGVHATPTSRIPNPTEVVVNGQTSPTSSALRDVGLGVAFLLVLLLLIASGFLLWWRALSRRLSPITGALVRVSRLGSWLGAPPTPEQTPYDYAEALGSRVPAERQTFESLTDLYVEERWGGQAAPDDEAATVYQRAQSALVRAIANRWREIPRWLFAWARPLVDRLRAWGDRLRRMFRRVTRIFDPPAYG